MLKIYWRNPFSHFLAFCVLENRKPSFCSSIWRYDPYNSQVNVADEKLTIRTIANDNRLTAYWVTLCRHFLGFFLRKRFFAKFNPLTYYPLLLSKLLLSVAGCVAWGTMMFVCPLILFTLRCDTKRLMLFRTHNQTNKPMGILGIWEQIYCQLDPPKALSLVILRRLRQKTWTLIEPFDLWTVKKKICKKAQKLILISPTWCRATPSDP